MQFVDAFIYTILCAGYALLYVSPLCKLFWMISLPPVVLVLSLYPML